MDNTITLRSLRVADLGIGTFIIIVGFFICVIAFLLSPLVKKPTALVISVSASYFIVILYLLNAPKTTADEESIDNTNTDGLWVVRLFIGIFLFCATLFSVIMIFVYNVTNEVMARTIGDSVPRRKQSDRYYSFTA